MKKVFILFISLYAADIAAQNVGIGTNTPAAKLHISSTGSEVLRVQASNPYISFFNGVTYKGYLWQNALGLQLGTATAEPIIISANYNDVAHFTPDGNVGINTNLPTERLDVAGNINLRGTLKIDGNTGTYGQVYVTGGPSFNPEWRTVAFPNNTRFSATLTGSGYNTALTYSQNYNTNTTNITIGTNSVTINKTGLYHIDAFLYFGAVYSVAYSQPSAPQATIYLSDGSELYYGAFSQDMTERIYYTCCFNKTFFYQTKFSYELYLTAGQNLTLSRSFSGPPASATFTNRGVLTGYLISE